MVEESERVVLSERDSLMVLNLLENPPASNAKLRATIAAMPKPSTAVLPVVRHHFFFSILRWLSNTCFPLSRYISSNVTNIVVKEAWARIRARQDPPFRRAELSACWGQPFELDAGRPATAVETSACFRHRSSN